MPYDANEPRRHKIPTARYTGENCKEYHAALRERGSVVVCVRPEAIGETCMTPVEGKLRREAKTTRRMLSGQPLLILCAERPVLDQVLDRPKPLPRPRSVSACARRA